MYDTNYPLLRGLSDSGADSKYPKNALCYPLLLGQYVAQSMRLRLIHFSYKYQYQSEREVMKYPLKRNLVGRLLDSAVESGSFWQFSSDDR